MLLSANARGISCRDLTLRRDSFQHRRAREVRSVKALVSAESNGTSAPGHEGKTKKSVVIVGGGWAGFGAAKHLSEQGYAVTLLDASPNPGGLSAGWTTPKGRTVEAGMKGFWYQYKNIFSLLEELYPGGRSSPDWPLTNWTTSGFWSPAGLVTSAPVFSALTQLPTLVGQFVHTFPLYWSLPLLERMTMLPFLATLADYTSSEEAFIKYDRMSAYELFRSCGVSERMYKEFLRPTLLVGLFAPPEELSAAVVLETLYFYALAHQNDFDVCWCKGTIADKMFQPLIKLIKDAGGDIVGNAIVEGVEVNEETGEITSVNAIDRASGLRVMYKADAVIFGVGVNAMQKLITASPVLAAAPDLRPIMNLKSIDVIATRIWLDRKIATQFPANVLSGFESTAGGTYFNLNELQDEYADAEGTVLSADFYHSNTLMPLSDTEIVKRVKQHVETCEPAFKDAKVVDSIVLRFARAVTHFSVGSYVHRPLPSTSIPNLFLCGDWVKGVPHGANGLSQERAYVTGLTAANLVVGALGVGEQASIIDVDPDEPHVAVARSAIRTLRDVASNAGLKTPFL
jgi:uncharacterized protein with NAD-binding domain and iron-sulfur cluster